MAKPGRGRPSPPSGSASGSSSRSRSRSYSGSDSRSSSRSRSPSRSRSFSSSSSQSRSVSSRSRSVSPKRKRFFLPLFCICLLSCGMKIFLFPSVWLRENLRANSWKCECGLMFMTWKPPLLYSSFLSVHDKCLLFLLLISRIPCHITLGVEKSSFP